MISILCYSNLLLVMLLVPNSLRRNLTEWDLWNRKKGLKSGGSQPSLINGTRSMRQRERDKHWVWRAECQSCWKQLLILIVLCQPCEYRPWGCHGLGVWSSRGSWHQPPWRLALNNELASFHLSLRHPLTEARCQTRRKAVLQQGSVSPTGV